MAKEIKAIGLAAGTSYFAVVMNPAGNYWTGSGNNFAAASGITWSAAGIALTADATITRDFSGDFPTAITTAAEYIIKIYSRAGGSPVVGDVQGTPAAKGTLDWSGSAEVTELLVFQNLPSGSGAWQVTIHVTDGTSSLGGVVARLYGGSTNVSGTTDISGNVTLNVDTGSYTLSLTKGGYAYSPTTQAISASGTLATQAMTLIVVTPPTDPGDCTVTGLAGLGEEVNYRRRAGSGTTGYFWERDVHTVTANAITGICSFTLKRGHYYQFQLDSGDWTPADTGWLVPAATTATVGAEVLGHLDS